MVFRKLNIYMQKNEGGPLFATYTKITLNYIKNLNVRVKTKTFRSKHRWKLQDIGFSNDCFDMDTKSRDDKREKKIDKLESIKNFVKTSVCQMTWLTK